VYLSHLQERMTCESDYRASHKQAPNSDIA
jgi:hypothetical protein